MHRRQFFHTSLGWLAAGSVISAAALPTSSFYAAPTPAASSLRVALIGSGWYGKSDLLRLMQVAAVKVVGLCDVDQQMLQQAAALIQRRSGQKKTIPTFLHYQSMLAKTKPDLVIIASPDHWHALMAIDAMAAGAHLYLQKPISVDVLEGEAILAAARKYNRKVQVGTQRRSTLHFQNLKNDIIDAGHLGRIGHVEMCCYYPMRERRQLPQAEIPDFFDYATWTGPAPLLPYCGLPHRIWRSRTEYCNGIMGDMCVHMLDTARWLLGLGWPSRISSHGGVFNDPYSWANTPDTQSAVFEYPDFNCHWQHRSWGAAPDPDYPWAIFIYGSKGTLKADVKHWEFIPNDLQQPRKSGTVLYEREQFPEDETEQDIEIHAAPATRAHFADLLAAIEEDRLPVADIAEGHISTAACILANLSLQLGRPLTYDPQQHIVVDDPVATALLRRPYRKDYTHPYDQL